MVAAEIAGQSIGALPYNHPVDFKQSWRYVIAGNSKIDRRSYFPVAVWEIQQA
jgi:hypothetical protein